MADNNREDPPDEDDKDDFDDGFDDEDEDEDDFFSKRQEEAPPVYSFGLGSFWTRDTHKKPLLTKKPGIPLSTFLLLCNTSFLLIFFLIVLYLLKLQNETITLRSNLQIQGDVSRQVEGEVSQYCLHASEHLHYVHKLLESDLQEQGEIQVQYFLKLATALIQQDKNINALYYADSSGNHYMVKRVRGGNIGEKIILNNGKFITVKWNFPFNKSRPGGYPEYEEFSLEEGYDPRRRSWYQEAQFGKENWVGPYPFFTDNFVGLTGAIGIKNGTTKSVVGIDVNVSYLSETLSMLPFGKLGYIVIKDDEDLLVAISDKENGGYETSQLKFDLNSGQQQIGIRTIDQLDSSPAMIYFAKNILSLSLQDLQDQYAWTQKDNLLDRLLNMFFPKYARSSNIRSIIMEGIDYGNLETAGNTYLFTRNNFSPIAGLDWISYTFSDIRDYSNSLDYLSRIISGIFLGFVLVLIIILQYISRQISKPLGILSSMMYDFSKHLKLDQDFHNDSRLKIEEISNIGNIYNGLQNGFRSFKKFVPDVIVRRSMNSAFLGSGTINSQMQKKEVSILFSDIEGFTSISERLSTQVLCECLEIYFSTMSGAIGDSGGLIDKFIGDAVMALFGVFRRPEESDQQIAAQAIAAAVSMQNKSELINEKVQKIAPGVRFHTRIGISTGEVMVGIIGAEQRLNFTAIGDRVNLASRLESLNKEYGTTIIASERSQMLASGLFVFRYLDQVQVRGKEEAEKVYEPIGHIKDLSNYQQSYYRNFNQLQQILEKGDESLSRKAIALLEEHFPDMKEPELLSKIQKIRAKKWANS